MAWVATVRGTYPTPEAGVVWVGGDLGCHSTLYVPNARGWYVYPVRTVRGAWGQAALCVRYVPNAGGWYGSVYVPNGGAGAYVSAQRCTGAPLTTRPTPMPVPTVTYAHELPPSPSRRISRNSASAGACEVEAGVKGPWQVCVAGRLCGRAAEREWC